MAIIGLELHGGKVKRQISYLLASVRHWGSLQALRSPFRIGRRSVKAPDINQEIYGSWHTEVDKGLKLFIRRFLYTFSWQPSKTLAW